MLGKKSHKAEEDTDRDMPAPVSARVFTPIVLAWVAQDYADVLTCLQAVASGHGQASAAKSLLERLAPK